MYLGPATSWVGSSDSEIKGVEGEVWVVIISSDGANAGTLELKDGGSGGSVRLHIEVPATAGESKIVSLPQGLRFKSSLYADVTDVGSVTVVYT